MFLFEALIGGRAAPSEPRNLAEQGRFENVLDRVLCRALLVKQDDHGEGDQWSATHFEELIDNEVERRRNGALGAAVWTFLQLEDICRASQVNKLWLAAWSDRFLRKTTLREAGAGEQHRFRYWWHVLRIDHTRAETLTRHGSQLASERFFHACVAHKHADTSGSAEANPGEALPLTQRALRQTVDFVCRPNKAALSKQGVEGEIKRDVGRTFPHDVLFATVRSGEEHEVVSPGQNMLANVLKASSICHADVGYCQGMNFVVGALLRMRLAPMLGYYRHLHDTRKAEHQAAPAPPPGSPPPASAQTSKPKSPSSSASDPAAAAVCRSTAAPLAFSALDPEQTGKLEAKAEEDVFWLLGAIIGQQTPSSLVMRNLWQAGVPQLKLRIFQFDRLLRAKLPKVHAHFAAISLAPDVLVSQWFLTLFAYSLPHDTLVRCWDIVFTDGWKMLFRAGLARLSAVSSELLQLDLEGTAKMLKRCRQLPSAGFSTREFLRLALSFKVTRGHLRELEQEFGVQLLRERLSGEQEWLMRYGETNMALDEHVLQALRHEITSLDQVAGSDAVVYQRKIEHCEQLLSSARTAVSTTSTALLEAGTDLATLLNEKQRLKAQVEERLIRSRGLNEMFGSAHQEHHGDPAGPAEPASAAQLTPVVQAVNMSLTVPGKSSMSTPTDMSDDAYRNFFGSWSSDHEVRLSHVPLPHGSFEDAPPQTNAKASKPTTPSKHSEQLQRFDSLRQKHQQYSVIHGRSAPPRAEVEAGVGTPTTLAEPPTQSQQLQRLDSLRKTHQQYSVIRELSAPPKPAASVSNGIVPRSPSSPTQTELSEDEVTVEDSDSLTTSSSDEGSEKVSEVTVQDSEEEEEEEEQSKTAPSRGGGLLSMCFERSVWGRLDPLATDLVSFQHKALRIEQQIQRCKAVYATALQQHAAARIEFEEAEEGKRSLTTQLLSLLAKAEGEKHKRLVQVSSRTLSSTF